MGKMAIAEDSDDRVKEAVKRATLLR